MKRFDNRQYLEDKLDRFRPSAGDEVTGLCPNCGKYGGFYVNTATGAFLCNKCSFRGRQFAALVAQIEGISLIEATSFIFRESVELRRRETLVSLRDRLQAIRPHAVAQAVTAVGLVDDPLPRAFVPCYSTKGGKDVWSLPRYLKERRVKSATAKTWGMGYVPPSVGHDPGCGDWREQHDKCMPTCSYRYAGRLVIPVECPNGRSFTARDMLGDQIPKYLNPTGTDFRRMLIGWQHVCLTGDIVLCEGPLDAIKLQQHGISALSLGGKELHDEQLSMLMALSSNTSITVMLDPEETLAPLKVATRLSCHFISIYISKLLEVDGAAERGLDRDGRPNKLDPGNCTIVEAYAAMDHAHKWTGSRVGTLRAKLEKAKQRWG